LRYAIEEGAREVRTALAEWRGGDEIKVAYSLLLIGGGAGGESDSLIGAAL
jgi:hypothetical protein